MSKIKQIDLTGANVTEVQLSNVFSSKAHNQAIFDAVLAEDAGRRQGTHSTLTKGEVRGGGKKPRPQKHSGNARQGSIRNPHWVGGGVAFGPKPNRNYKLKVNTKINKIALISAINLKLNDKAIVLLEDKIALTKPATKTISKMLATLKVLNKKVLVIANDKAEVLIKSAENINRVIVKK
jgi:large subunit ribosomal protein L4